MPRVESVRPGDVLEADFGTYPLAELLMGILRGNLTGMLEVVLDPDRHDAIYFRDGVPIAVTLPDVPVSLSRLLAARGAIDPETAARLETQAARSGQGESRIVAFERLVADGVLGEAIRARARAQVVRLFDIGPRAFRFVEGEPLPQAAELTILQTLPIIYEGLSTAADRSVVSAFWGRYRGHRFRLSDTYPAGVDPFEWGPEIEAAICRLGVPEHADLLLELGLSEEVVTGAIVALHLADMLEVHDPVPRTSAQPPREMA